MLYYQHLIKLLLICFFAVLKIYIWHQNFNYLFFFVACVDCDDINEVRIHFFDENAEL